MCIGRQKGFLLGLGRIAVRREAMVNERLTCGPTGSSQDIDYFLGALAQRQFTTQGTNPMAVEV